MKHTRLVHASLLVFPLLACGNDSDSGAESQQIGTNLRQCDLVTSGKLYPAVGDSDVARCLARCVGEADCQELERLYCLASPSARLLDCQNNCFSPQTCDDGETRFDLRDRCNGETRCEDGADEADCPDTATDPRFCEQGGDAILPFQRCDGINNCADGTDEKGCPKPVPEFTCKTTLAGFTRVIPLSQVCDLVPNCPDMSDEGDAQGCAKLSCTSD